MSELTVARRYAHALYEEAAHRDVVPAIDEDVAMVQQSLDEVRELVRLVESPVIPKKKKKDVLGALFEGRVEPLTVQFLQLLVEKDREALLPRILRRYQALRDEQRGIVEVQARVAAPLSDDERQKLVDQLEAMTGQQVRLDVDEQPDLIGGLVIRIGDRVYDGSVRQKLDNLRDTWHHSTAAAGNGQA